MTLLRQFDKIRVSLQLAYFILQLFLKSIHGVPPLANFEIFKLIVPYCGEVCNKEDRPKYQRVVTFSLLS